MSFNSKKTIVSMGAGVFMLIAYIVYAFGQYSPAPEDIKSWAVAMLVFIGISIAAVIIVQIVFHIATAIGIAIKEQELDREKIDRRFSAITMEDERDKLISLKSSHLSSIIAGTGFVAALFSLVFGASAVLALHIIFCSCAAASTAEGLASVYFYEKGIRNG